MQFCITCLRYIVSYASAIYVYWIKRQKIELPMRKLPTDVAILMAERQNAIIVYDLAIHVAS